MPNTLVECVLNFSEGRDSAKVDAVVEAMKLPGVYLLGAPEPALSLPKGPAFGTWDGYNFTRSRQKSATTPSATKKPAPGLQIINLNRRTIEEIGSEG